MIMMIMMMAMEIGLEVKKVGGGFSKQHYFFFSRWKRGTPTIKTTTTTTIAMAMAISTLLVASECKT